MSNSDANGIRFDDGVARISGDLGLDTVAGIYQQAGEALRHDGERVDIVDLDAVERIDSSGLALLLQWQAAREREDARLEIRNAPDDLLRLARLCGAEDLLRLSRRESGDARAGNGND